MDSRAVICLGLLAAAVPSALSQTAGTAGQQVSATVTAPVAEAGPAVYTIPAGTKIPLVLKNEISTRDARPGDPVFLVSDFPVVQNGFVVLPAGLGVSGVIDSVQRAGKTKGRAQLQLHFVSIILPNNVVVPLPGSLDRVPNSSGAKVKNAEGTVEQNGSKGKDGQRIATDTLTGAGVGGLIGYGTGSAGVGAGIGAGAGAAVGVLTTLFTRGNDVVFPQGTSMMMVFSRPVALQQSQLTGMPASTGMIVPAPVPAQPLPASPLKPN